MGDTALAIVLLAIFDLAVMFLLKVSLKDVNISNALREKSVAPLPPGQGGDGGDNTSFSRLAGTLGAIVLAVFFWMLGNVVIWQLLVTPTQVATTWTTPTSTSWLVPRYSRLMPSIS